MRSRRPKSRRAVWLPFRAGLTLVAVGIWTEVTHPAAPVPPCRLSDQSRHGRHGPIEDQTGPGAVAFCKACFFRTAAFPPDRVHHSKGSTPRALCLRRKPGLVPRLNTVGESKVIVRVVLKKFDFGHDATSCHPGDRAVDEGIAHHRQEVFAAPHQMDWLCPALADDCSAISSTGWSWAPRATSGPSVVSL